MRKLILWLAAGMMIMSLGCAGPRRCIPSEAAHVPIVPIATELDCVPRIDIPKPLQGIAGTIRFHNDFPDVWVKIKWRQQGLTFSRLEDQWLEPGEALDFGLSYGVNEYYVYVDSKRTGYLGHSDWQEVRVHRPRRTTSEPGQDIHFGRSRSWSQNGGGNFLIDNRTVRLRAGDMYDTDRPHRRRR